MLIDDKTKKVIEKRREKGQESGIRMQTEHYATEKVCSGPCTVSGKRGKEGEGLPIR